MFQPVIVCLRGLLLRRNPLCVKGSQSFVSDIDSRVEVTVYNRPTVRAHPFHLSKLDIRVLTSTVPASFRRRIPLIDDDVVFPLFCELVLEKSTEHTESVVRNSFPEFERLCHSTQIDVFHTYSIIGIGYLPTELMAKVKSLIGDSSGKLADSCFLLEVPVGPFLAMR